MPFALSPIQVATETRTSNLTEMHTETSVYYLTTYVPYTYSTATISNRTFAQLEQQALTTTKVEFSTETSMFFQYQNVVTTRVWGDFRDIGRGSTLPYFWARLAGWLMVGLIFPLLAYRRINAYRTRHHIYLEILSYTSSGTRLSSHIMRKCNLETGKFEKYMRTLTEKGFLDQIDHDGRKQYHTSLKGLDMIRDKKLTQFMNELP